MHRAFKLYKFSISLIFGKFYSQASRRQQYPDTRIKIDVRVAYLTEIHGKFRLRWHANELHL